MADKRFWESVEQPLTLIESETSDGARRIRAIGITADVVNANNRIYPRSVLESAINNLRLNESRAGSGRLILTGEAEHPSDKGGRRNILETVVSWDAANLDETGQVLIEGSIVPTSKGRDILALIEAGVPVGISQRAYGRSKTAKRAGKSVEEITELTITGYDLVAEPSDPNGRILESQQEDIKPMDINEVREFLKENPEMLDKAKNEAATRARAELAESMGVDVADLDKAIAEAQTAKKELEERNRRDAINTAIVEATKDLAYGEHINAEFVRAIHAANPQDVKAVAGLVEAKRAEYDSLMSARELAQKGKGPVIEKVESAFEAGTGVPEFARVAHEITERMVMRGDARPIAEKAETKNDLYIRRYLESYDNAYKRQLAAEAKLFAEAEQTSDLNLPYSVQRAIIPQALNDLVAASVFDFGFGNASPDYIYYEAYSAESGATATITDETFTADHDTWVSLAHARVQTGTVTVELGGTSTAKTEWTDYVVDYANGRIMVLSTGSISDSADLDITYTYDSVREGEMSAIQRGKGTLSRQSIEFVADRLATQISDEAIVFSRSQLGWDATSRTLAMVAREIAEFIDEGVIRLGLSQAHVAANSGGTWTAASDTLAELVEKIGTAKLAIQADKYTPDAVLMSLTNADRLENYFIQTTGTLAANMRANSGLLGTGATGLVVKGLPVYASAHMPDTKILVSNRELVQKRTWATKPMHLEGPFPSYSSTNLVAATQYYVEEYNATVSLIAAKGGYVTIA